MFVAHTPCDGEVLLAPALRKNIIASNIYYDMDLIEYYLRVPLVYRLEFSAESKFHIAIGKRVFRSIAKRYLPKNIVNRKKGFLVPVKSDLYDLNSFMGINLTNKKSKYGAKLAKS